MLLDAEREAARPYGWSSRPPDAPTGGWQLHTRTLHSTGTSMLGGGDAHGAFDLRPASQQGLNPRRLPATKFPGVYVPQPPSAVPTAAENGGLATGSLRHKLPWERPITPAMAAGGSAGLTPRRPAPPPSYARPSTRAEAISLSERLRATLCEGGNRESVDAAWHGVFCELVRQVYVHCNERGQLLDAVRVYLEGELKMARATLAEQQRELNRLRKDASVLMGTGDKRGAGDKSHEAAAAAAREQIERRVEMIFDAGGRLPSEGKASLVGRLVGACEPEERGSLVEAALAATPHAERLTSLNTELDRLVVADLMAVLSQVLESITPAHRARLMMLLVEQLNGTERAAQALELAQTLDMRGRASLAKHVLHGLSKLDRQPTITQLLRALSRDERIASVAEVLGTVPLGEATQIVSVRSSDMSSADRMSLAAEVLGTMSQPERMQMVQEQLVTMPTDERGKMLGALFGMMPADERASIEAKLSRTKISLSMELESSRAD